ncbi:S8 family serine peptidase [Coralloluteibacterium stylophorae]|uniref:S8 family serine peptidase n=3 Tax=Coralloluteibacterium stylophorae TaxID=1776034 RepID=A0AAP2FZ19_9GAMM|nr:S8 family serine peptidase [Coralloluteibacterium stylophorae]
MATRRTALAAAVALVLSLGLGACGGGGSNTRDEDPPPVEEPPTIPPEPEPDPEPNPDPGADEPPVDVHLDATRADVAQAAGFTGAGVVTGVIDTGVNRNHVALDGRVVEHYVYVDPSSNDLSVDDADGHGTWVSQIMAGADVAGGWPGGVAPGAEIVSARVINDEPPEDDGSGEGNEVPENDGTPEFLAQVHADLIAADVRVMNNSWGGLYWDSQATTDRFAAAYEDFIFANDGLVVFATGNSGMADPSDSAALPSKGGAAAAALERGWLTVAALDSVAWAADETYQLSDYSNACGIAMDYCLVAPGEVIVIDEDETAIDGDTTYWIVGGTSFAAPQVSGAAAMVWEAFPWFDNDLVRQTLLGTAQDIGDPGVDATFGHGLLDVGAAVLGPARFDWGDVVADFDGAETFEPGGIAYWDNDISGEGGLVKRGDGVLVLTGDNTYTGATTIEEGLLAIDGTLAASDVSVGEFGGLTGFGTVAGDVVNAGVLGIGGADEDASAESEVLFTIEGDYLHGADARLAVELGYVLEVGGTATIEGGELHVLGAKEGYTPAGLVPVLTADGGVDGIFSELTRADGIFLNASIVYDTNAVGLLVTTFSATGLAASGRIQQASLPTAQRVENAFRSIDTMLAAEGGRSLPEGFLGAAGAIQGASSAAMAEATLQSLSGQVHAASAALAFEGIDANQRALSSRFDALLDDARLAGAWSDRLGMHGGWSQAGLAGLDFDLDGWLVGNDVRFGRNGVAGFSFGRSDGDARIDGGFDRNRNRSSTAMAYLGAVGDAWYAQGSIGAGRFDQDVRRMLQLGADVDSVWTEYGGHFSSLYAETGMRTHLGGMALTPFVGAQYARVERDGFSEADGSGFGLRSDAGFADRWQAIAGVRGDRTLRLASGRPLTLDVRAQWQETLDARGEVFDASFTGVDDWQPLTGVGLAEYGGLVGFGLSMPLARSAWLQMDYDHRFGQRGDARMLSASFRYGF